jgi:hypothetical protein
MRLFRFITTTLAVIAGLVGAFALVLVGSVAFILLRLFGRPAVAPGFRRPAAASPRPPAYSGGDDVIDVVATEVKE